jgi:hypothetical protein
VSVADLPATSPPPAPRPRPAAKPLGKRAMMLVRRGHLYLGLFLFPWAVLYGVTAFLFNHPTAFADAGSAGFGADALRGTPLEAAPAPADTAARVVAALNDRAGTARYTLVADPPPAYARDFVAAQVKAADGGSLTVFFDLTGPAGSVRGSPPRPEPKGPVKAPFAVGGGGGPPSRATRGGPPKGPRPDATPADGLTLPDPLPELVKASAPRVLAHLGYPAAAEVSVPTVPDLQFRLADSDGSEWAATYNAATGAVGGKPAVEGETEGMSWRRFLLRLHVAHGYPSGGGVRWWWAVVVDAMAFVMVFWGVSGLLMWWQLKAQRRLGVGLLAASGVAATVLAVGMYQVMR